MLLKAFVLSFVYLVNQITAQQISVQGPQDIVNSINFVGLDKPVFNFTVANFGLIPWGKRIIAPLTVAEPLNACEKIKPLDPKDFSNQLPIVLVERGGCKFTHKAKNIQEAGGRLALIFDNVFEESEYITMGDDGSGNSVRIPSVFIKESYGEELKTQALKLQQKGKYITLSAQFSVQQTPIVDVGFYINLPDEGAQFFIEDFREIYKEFDKGTVNIYPVYQFLEGLDRGNCIGKYCCFDPDGVGSATGAQIANEQLRQLCIHKELGVNNWFDYVYNFKEQECKVQSYDQCSEKVQKQMFDKKKQEQLKNCFENSWLQKGNQNSNNTLLEQQLEKIKYSGVFSWPGVHINNITYFGRYAAYPVQEAICAGLSTKNVRCMQILYPSLSNGTLSSGSGVSTWGIIAIIVSILIVIFGLIVFGYKKYVRREMKSEMKTQVNEMVSNYIKFYEAKQKDTEN